MHALAQHGLVACTNPEGTNKCGALVHHAARYRDIPLRNSNGLMLPKWPSTVTQKMVNRALDTARPQTVPCLTSQYILVSCLIQKVSSVPVGKVSAEAALWYRQAYAFDVI